MMIYFFLVDANRVSQLLTQCLHCSDLDHPLLLIERHNDQELYLLAIKKAYTYKQHKHICIYIYTLCTQIKWNWHFNFTIKTGDLSVFWTIMPIARLDWSLVHNHCPILKSSLDCEPLMINALIGAVTIWSPPAFAFGGAFLSRE